MPSVRPVRGRDALGHLWEGAGDCLGILDARGAVLWLNRAAREAWKAPDGAVPIGRPFRDLWEEAGRGGVDLALAAALDGPGAGRGFIASPTGVDAIWDVRVSAAGGAAAGGPALLVVGRDVTSSLRLQAMLDWTARSDGMTGLLNRSAFIQEVGLRMSEGRPVALALLDVDHLKRANDTDGHLAGNELIKHFAARLGRAGDGSAVAARLGGDEFALAFFGAVDEAELHRVLRDLCRPARVAQLSLPYSASAGVAVSMADAPSFDELYLRADMALYACKARGGGQHQFFDAALREGLQKTASLVRVVTRALRSGGVVPFYQPKADLVTGGVVGFEALLRVRFPDGTVQTADAVAEALREADLAAAIDQAMLEAVLADVKAWRAQGASVPVAVNVSDGGVRAAGFADRFLGTLAEGGLDPSLLEVEVTETVLLDSAGSCVEANLLSLSAAGVRVALDDFGTGYASLSHLKRFPISTVKIDKQFVRDLPDDSGDLAIVQAMVGLGSSLSLEVVAEGVERPEQMATLRRLGCRTGQGFLFAPAVPAEEAWSMLRDSRVFDLGRAAQERSGAAPGAALRSAC